MASKKKQNKMPAVFYLNVYDKHCVQHAKKADALERRSSGLIETLEITRTDDGKAEAKVI